MPSATENIIKEVPQKISIFPFSEAPIIMIILNTLAILIFSMALDLIIFSEALPLKTYI